MKKLTFLLLFCILSATKLFAQNEDITGMWYGELLLTDSAGELVHLPYEIAVSEDKKGKFKGYSRIVFHAHGKDEAGVQDIVIERKGSNIIMEDEGFIDHQFSINPSSRVKKTMTVQLTVTEKEMIMEGEWNTNKTRRYIPMKGTVVLRRKNDFKKSELFKSLDTLKLVSNLSFKDRPSLPDEPAVATATKPEPKPETKPGPPPVVVAKEPEPEPIPDLVIPAIGKVTASLNLNTKPWPMRTKVMPITKPKKVQMDLLAKSNIKPPPPKVVAVKPEPVTAAVTPKPERKEPVRKEPAAEQAPEKKPETVAVKPAPPKPTPPPVAYVAPSTTGGAAELDKRVTKSDQSFYFENDSLVLTLYDNGEVDGDTVTVVMNGNVIFSKAGLNTKPNTKTVYITPNMDSVKLVMYAESLGEIPPNTGLLIVNDGEKRYDVRFSADLNTNAAIVLRRKKGQ